MAERPNLFTFFVLAAIAISSIVSGMHYWDEEDWDDKESDEDFDCESIAEFRGRGCISSCYRHERICSRCLCGGGDAVCEIQTRKCYCRKSGWKGIDCSEPCDNGFHGQNCNYKCHCENNATCDRFSGGCTCAAGYEGSWCQQKCPKGTHGYECSNECKCQNDAICHHEDGSCDCTVGWMGPVCAEPCPEGTYGKNCSETCDCFKNAPCNVTTGLCIYTDEMFDCHCDVNPRSEAKKLNDSQECSSLFNKNNTCLPGFSGTNCENRACPANKWGQTCTNECKCRNGSYCHPLTGGCWCELGWTGEDCSVSLNKVIHNLMTK